MNKQAYFSRHRRNNNRDGILFILPALIAFILFTGIPMLMAFGLVFMDYNLLKPPRFVGLASIRRLMIDPMPGRALANTFRYFVMITPIHCILALVLAYVIMQVRNTRLQSLYRNIVYFPTIVTTASVAIAWNVMFATDTGFVNYYVRQLGGSNVPWLTNSNMIYVTTAIFSAWKFIGTTFLYYFVGLQNIPATYHEAALIDGAGKRQAFFRIGLPLLTPTMFFVFITNMIGVFQIFEEPYFFSRTNASTKSMALLIYEMAFDNIRIGYGSLLAIIMFFIILTITVVQFIGQRKWVNYDYE